MTDKPKRKISRVFIHCSASDAEGAAYTGQGLVNTIDAWHRARKPPFNGIGYHYVIDKVGSIMKGRDIERSPAAQEGNNAGTIAICLHGLRIDKFTPAQFSALLTLCNNINSAYAGSVTFHGHCEVNRFKTCPVFKYKDVLGLDQFGRMPLKKGT